MINEYDKIRLKSGERASILEIFDDGDYLAEIISKNGEVRVDEIKKENIKAVIREVEETLSA